MKVYRPSFSKVLILCLICICMLGFIFGYETRGDSLLNLEGFGLGSLVGGLFSLFILLYGSGQTIKIDNAKVFYFNNLLERIFFKGKEMPISKILSVFLGVPKINKDIATFSAINILSEDKEITVNPDLFKKCTIQNFLRELKRINPAIKFDTYATNMIGSGDSEKIFRNTVYKYLLLTIFSIILGTVSVVGMKKLFS